MPITEADLVKLLTEKGLTISACESCTGGLFSSTVVNVPGSSAVLHSSVVAYSNDAKMKFAGVKKETLSAFGAVSVETAHEMASGIRLASGADIGVALTGIAGPDGGTPAKPVGLVCFAIDFAGDVTSFKQNFSGSRQEIREASVKFLISKLIGLLSKN